MSIMYLLNAYFVFMKCFKENKILVVFTSQTIQFKLKNYCLLRKGLLKISFIINYFYQRINIKLLFNTQ